MPTAKQQMAKFNREAKKMLNQATNAKRMRMIANEAVKIIVERTQDDGKGVAFNGGSRLKLRDVSPDYAEWRDEQRSGEKSAKRKLSKAKRKPRKRVQYSPKGAKGLNCNLTLTGRMLRTLRTIKASKKEAKIGWSIERERDKAQWAIDGGREFINLSNIEIDKLSKILKEEIKKEAKKI